MDPDVTCIFVGCHNCLSKNNDKSREIKGYLNEVNY